MNQSNVPKLKILVPHGCQMWILNHFETHVMKQGLSLSKQIPILINKHYVKLRNQLKLSIKKTKKTFYKKALNSLRSVKNCQQIVKIVKNPFQVTNLMIFISVLDLLLHVLLI